SPRTRPAYALMATSLFRSNRTAVPPSAFVAIATSCVVGACAAASLTALVLLLLPREWAMVQRIELACVLAGFALLGGWTFAHQLRQRRLRADQDRERRYHTLLGIAADRLWEQDRHFRFTYVASPRDPAGGAAMQDRIGLTPWQMPDCGLSEDQLDAHRADLEAHRSFSGLLVRRRDAAGRSRIHSISGEPRFDAAGMFIGYWGVTRDVTEEVDAQRAMTSSETRYRELFERSPSPLLLHRKGLVFDANAAAARLFGFADAASMAGIAIVDLVGSSENRERAIARVAALEDMPVGEGTPVTDYETRATDGRLINVQATAVRVDTATGPATLTIMFDISARQRVEAALRRSEAMLSHLFATSPDCISLSEIETGRHTMVNAAFTRVTGYTSSEAVGHTATEMGIWHDLEERDRLGALLRKHGTVTDLPVTIRAKSGARVSMRISAARFAMDTRNYLVINARDVTATERTRLEHAAILERASIGIAFTRDRLFVQVNPRFEDMFGWAPGELAGKPGAVVWPGESDYAEVARLAGPLLSTGQRFEVERQMQRKDGSVFWCRILAQVVNPSHPSQGGTIWIVDDVTERRRLDQALAAARDAAEAASTAKSAFLANTSHEIRTPLNGLLGLARLAMRQDIDAERRQHYLEQILDSAQGLAVILSDILDLSKIEAGKIALEEVAFDLREALTGVHQSYRTAAEAKGLEMRLTIADELPATVLGDPVRVRQILTNFISNAIKFTERGSIRIEASGGAGTVRFAVTDSGAGVDAATQERLFKPFSQGDSSTTRRYGGTGLGLSICRELARLMGGEVGMQSSAGHGSTFWARLPLRAAFSSGATLSTEAHDIELLNGTRVLLVEDNPVNMMIAAATLEQWGVKVDQARDGRMALEAVREASATGRLFDAVLMDVQMPVMSGHEAAAELRKRYGPTVLPIIALTAAALVTERDQALAAGMNDFLTKPIDAVRLRQTLARHVRGAERHPVRP
ncbi:MAG: PAS domain S-box protein, partial [Pseudomonadota bacterium]|nr:PAS domain S-box protein [Pseudomonadota bacterium]